MTVSSAPRADLGYMSEYSGWNLALSDVLETIPDVQWPDSVRTYAHMRTDPQLTAVLNAYTLPSRYAPKHVDPAGCKAEVVKLVADDLGLPILGQKQDPGPARRRGVNFDEHYRLALLNLIFGHMPFEQRYDIIDGQARLADLSERMPSTITQIDIDDGGDLTGILQFGSKAAIPVERLVWYVHEREGSMWQGRSMLRPAYGPWLIKHNMWRVLATSNARFGMGVPTVNAPQGATDQQIRTAAQLAAATRVGDQSGVGLPYGFTMNLVGLTGSVPDTLAFIEYLDRQMAQMVLASILNLDASPNGSRALGETLVDLLTTSINAVGQEMASVLTKLAVQMVDYNFGEDENAPRIVIGDVNSHPEVTAEAIQGLMQVGAISPDPALENWVRDRYGLPEREEPPTPPPTPSPTPPDPSGMGPQMGPEGLPQQMPMNARRTRRALKASQRTFHRELNQIEASAGTDPGKIDGQWNTALDGLVRNWSYITKAQRQALSDSISAAVDSGDAETLGSLELDTQDATQTLTDAMVAMAGDAADEMKREAKRQGVTITGETIDEMRIGHIAAAVARIMTINYASAAGREALRVWAPTSTGSEVADAVDIHMGRLSDAYLRTQLGNALSSAQNEGRFAVIDVAPPADYYASEILDTNTCVNCAEIDGQQFTDMDAAAQAYASGGYVDCLGSLRCRGIVVAVYHD